MFGGFYFAAPYFADGLLTGTIPGVQPDIFWLLHMFAIKPRFEERA